MKKNNKINKIIILSLIVLMFTICLVIFILNYTKDSSSLSIIEKNWINGHTSNVIDVSVYNDVPIYGKDGEGLIFSYLEKFSDTYGVKFNKISYLNSGTTNLRDVAFKVMNYDAVDNNSIEMYKDYYVIVGLESDMINDISDLEGSTLGVFDADLMNIKYYLNDGKNIKIVALSSIDEMLTTLEKKEVDYIAIPENLYLDKILENDLNVVYHISELYKKYVLTVNNDNTFKSIMTKFNEIYKNEYLVENNKKVFLDSFFKYKEISDVESRDYYNTKYVFGYVGIMPFENTVNKEFVGTLANYLSGFEDLTNVDFELVQYKNINELRQAFSKGEVDLLFANFNTDGVNVDVLSTNSLFREDYVVLSKNAILVNSIRSLKGYELYTVNNTYIYDYLVGNGISTKAYDDTDVLLRNIKSDSIVIIDRDTYEYYKDNKFRDYKIIYQNSLDNNYNFVVRDVKKNRTFYELFNYYVSSVNYKTIKYDYNTDYVVNSRNEFSTMLRYLAIILAVTFVLIIGLIVVLKIRSKKNDLKKEDKLKFIDVMTSLKNRNYLNYNIKTWDENVIYPQSIIIIDLNNIKYINDNYGHEEGDEVIKKAASILINNQQEKSDIIRTDGNEFLIYMVGFDEKQIMEYIRVLSKELKELPHGFGATLGYSMIIDDAKTIDDAINEATLSMRQAKEKL